MILMIKYNIIRSLEKWAINKLYLLDFHKFGRISRHRRMIIFDFCGSTIWWMFPTFKKWLPMFILERICGWDLYEVKLNLWCYPIKRRLEHTWGEIQDIIRLNGKHRPIKPLPLSRIWERQS